MRKLKKKLDKFPIILIIILIFFSTIMLLSIPVLFNYKSIEKEIEKKFYNDFKIKLTILDDIKYNFLPKPHLTIKKARLKLNEKNDKLADIETDNLKIYIHLKNIYSKKKTEITEVEIKNTNFNITIEDLKEFRNHLYYKINKPIVIKKSKFFYLDKKGNVITISPIYKLKYFIDQKNEYKQLKIKGNIFDTDFISLWKRYYDDPRSSKHEIKFKNPNVIIENLFTYNKDFNYNGNVLINFLDEYINFGYLAYKEKIIIKSKDYNNQKIKINSIIDLNPFYFNSNLTFINKDFEFIIDNILQYLLNFNIELLGNINGKLILNLKNLDNEIVDSGKINLIANEKTIKILESLFEIKNVGIVKSEYRFEENLGEIIFKSENILEIKNINEFAKKFQLNINKVKKIRKIYFDLQKNIDTNEISISNIHINKFDKNNIVNDSQNIKNIQILKSFLAKTLY